MSATLTFLSSIQPATAAAGPNVVIELTVKKDAVPETVTVPLRLYGPGDCLGVDPRQIIRTDPPRGAGDADPTRLVAAECDAHYLPWLLSPPAPQGRLTPWICLAVLRAAQVRISHPPHLPLPVIDIFDQSEIALLPDPAKAWAWAHAQVLGPAADVDAALQSHPERTLARLLSPRRLAENDAYVACVVPLFEAGRLAGLGQDSTAAGAAPAWSAVTSEVLRLPVYYSWQFSTRSAAATFSGLANRLRPGSAQRLGRRRVFVGAAGHPLPAIPRGAPGAHLGFDGALSPTPIAEDPWEPNSRSRFADAYAAMFESESSAVGPPMYGRAQAAVPFRAPRATWPRWLLQLNTDPRYRAAAALGVRVVQHDQEQLVAASWVQAAQIRAANTIVRNGELAEQVSLTIFERRLRHLPTPTLLQITTPAHVRVRLDAPPTLIAGVTVGRTLRGRIVASSFPTAAATTSFRRVIGGGAVGRRVTAATVDTMLRRFAAASLRMPVAQVPRGTVRLDQVSQAVGLPDRILARANQAEVLGASGAIGWRMLDELTRDVSYEPLTTVDRAAERVESSAEPSALRMLPGRPPETGDVGETGPRRVRLNAANLRFQEAAEAHQAYLDRVAAPQPIIAQMAVPTLSLDSVRDVLVGDPRLPSAASALLHPSRAVAPQVRARVSAPTTRESAGDSAAPIRFAPHFPQPMAAALRQLGGDFILPGVGDMPPDTAILLVPNARFIEAFMVGLNDELTRELAWRGFPVDSRATYFDRFWDTRSSVMTPAPDIRPIESWPDAASLGQNITSVARIVLVIRGEIARAHGTVNVYAVAATTRGDLGTTIAYPVFRTSLGADVLAIGFDLIHAVVIGNPGWYFVFEEQASEPAFDASVIDEPLPANAAVLANAALRKSARIAIHGATLMPEGQ